MSTLIACINIAYATIHCPDCPTGQAARAAITSDPQRWVFALAVAAPFIVATLMIGALIRAGRPPISSAWHKRVRAWYR